MVIALLALLGVDLIVIVVILVLILGRRRWLKHQPGEFSGAIRVVHGKVDGVGPKWKRGSARWVRDVLVWTKAPLLLQNQLVPVDGLSYERAPDDGELKRLGDSPIVLAFAVKGARIEIATKREHRRLVEGPLYVDATGLQRESSASG